MRSRDGAGLRSRLGLRAMHLLGRPCLHLLGSRLSAMRNRIYTRVVRGPSFFYLFAPSPGPSPSLYTHSKREQYKYAR